MASTIRLVIVDEHGDEISEMAFRIDYGNEEQRVIIVLDAGADDDACEHDHSMTAREALDYSMAQQLAMSEGYDA